VGVWGGVVWGGWGVWWNDPEEGKKGPWEELPVRKCHRLHTGEDKRCPRPPLSTSNREKPPKGGRGRQPILLKKEKVVENGKAIR